MATSRSDVLSTVLPGERWQELVPGLRVDVHLLADVFGDEPGQPFLLAGLAILEQALAEARDDRWWHALPNRLYRHLARECERALLVVELGERVQALHAEQLWQLTHDRDGRRLDTDLAERVARTVRKP